MLTFPNVEAAAWKKIHHIGANFVLFSFFTRIEELKELGDLSPHWDNLRQNVITHYEEMVSIYQESLTELEKYTGKMILLCNSNFYSSFFV